jgi:hypothetical protein
VLAFSSSTTFTERFVEATSAFLKSCMSRENVRPGFDGLWDEIISAFTVPAILKQNPAIVIALRDGQVECREYGMSYTFGNIWGCATGFCESVVIHVNLIPLVDGITGSKLYAQCVSINLPRLTVHYGCKLFP